MINPFKKARNTLPEEHILMDIEEWPIDSEYAILGVNEGWLMRHRTRAGPYKVTHYYLHRNRSP